MLTSAFTLGDIPAAQRFRYWQDAICQTYLNVDCRPLGNDSINGIIQSRAFGSVQLSETISPPMVYSRNFKTMEDGNTEFFQLVLSISGRGIVQQSGRETSFSPGDMAIYSSSEDSVVSYPDGSVTQVFKIPTSLLMDRLDTTHSIGGTLIDGSTPLGVMARSIVRECVNLEPSARRDDNRICNGALDILAAAISASLPVDQEGMSLSTTLSAAKRYIENYLSDPELDIHRVAGHVAISVRTLNRLFATDGTTANAWIWSRRLGASHKLLSEGKVNRVSQAAFDCGFNDLSHFGRAFKKRYGTLPLDVLNKKTR